MTKLIGIDVSEWQEPKAMNYAKIAEQIDFAILRVGVTGTRTGATYYKDSEFENHYRGFKNVGIPMGVYWYSCANTEAEGIAEARKCLQLIEGKEFEYPIYIDVEDAVHQGKTDPATLTKAVIAFCETIETAGYYVGIYASLSWFNRNLVFDMLDPYDVWIACWTKDKPDKRMGMWQFTSSGRFEGYSGNLDVNYAYKDYPKIIRECGLNHLNQKKTGSEKPASKPPEPAKSEALTYTVKPGDSLWKIAQQFLGNGRKFRELQELNGLGNSTRIYPGQVLKLRPAEAAPQHIEVGNRVKIIGSNYATGAQIPDWVKQRSHAVSQVSEDGSEVLLGWPDGICSWVRTEDVRRVD